MRDEFHHLHFLKQGNHVIKKERFYWQNADKTMTLVGIGHAAVLMSENTDIVLQIFQIGME